MAYCTVADVLGQRGKGAAAATDRDNALAAQAIADADAWIDQHCGRSFEKHSGSVREFAPRKDGVRDIRVGDVAMVTDVECRRTRRDPWVSVGDLDSGNWALGDPQGPGFPADTLWLMPDMGAWPYQPAPVKTVRVTGLFGWSAVPDAVHRASVLRANLNLSMYALRGLVGDSIEEAASSDFGVLMDIERYLGNYRRFVSP